MATKTLIRSKRQHEVRLEEGSQIARSQQQQASGDAAPPVPVSIRKTSAAAGSRRTARAEPAPAAQVSETAAPTRPARKKVGTTARQTPLPPASPAPAKVVKTVKAAPAAAHKPAVKKPAAAAAQPVQRPSPRLPARVPADGLWEADSAVMQRLQSLIERNAQLSEQLQRLQSNTPLKGSTP